MASIERQKISSPEKNRVMYLHNDGKLLSYIAAIIGRTRIYFQRIIAKFINVDT